MKHLRRTLLCRNTQEILILRSIMIQTLKLKVVNSWDLDASASVLRYFRIYKDLII